MPVKIVGIIPARYASSRFPGKPLALRVTALLKPPRGVTVTVLVPVFPCATVAFVAEREKSGVSTGVTFRLTLVHLYRFQYRGHGDGKRDHYRH